MRNKVFSVFIIAVLIVAASCNIGKEKQSDESNKQEEQLTAMSIEISDSLPADGGNFILTIKGGIPFASVEKPFKIESKYIGNKEFHNGEIFPLEFKKESDGVYKIQINTSCTDESEQQLIVTDSKGTTKTANFTIQYYP